MHWEEYTDWHYRDRFNHHLLALLYARNGDFAKAEDSLQLLKGSSYFARTQAMIEAIRQILEKE